MNKGFISLHRKILDWEWYKNTNVFRVFLHLLIKANHQDQKWQGIEVKRGQRITSYENISTEIGDLSVHQVRTALNKLKLTGEVTSQSTSKYTVITITNYIDYQGNDNQRNSQVTSRRQADDKQVATNNNENNENNENKGTHTLSNWKGEYGEKYIEAFNKLFNSKFRLTPDRIKKLKLRFQTYDSEEISTALINLSKSKFHHGDNDRGWKADPDFLIRSDEQVDKWLNHGGSDERK